MATNSPEILPLQGLKAEGWEVIGNYTKYLYESPLTGAVALAFGQGILMTPQRSSMFGESRH